MEVAFPEPGQKIRITYKVRAQNPGVTQDYWVEITREALQLHPVVLFIAYTQFLQLCRIIRRGINNPDGHRLRSARVLYQTVASAFNKKAEIQIDGDYQ